MMNVFFKDEEITQDDLYKNKTGEIELTNLFHQFF